MYIAWQTTISLPGNLKKNPILSIINSGFSRVKNLLLEERGGKRKCPATKPWKQDLV